MKKISILVLSMALVAFGAAFAVSSNVGAQTLPSGCSSTSGFSANTGAPCNGSNVIPVGCSSTAGFSAATGQPCNGYGIASNGGSTFPSGCSSAFGYSAINGAPCSGMTGMSNGMNYYLAGCSSNSGYSTVSGISGGTVANISVAPNGATYLPGCSSLTGYSTLTGQPCVNLTAGSTVTPGLPDTGMGADAPLSIMLLVLSIGLVGYGATRLMKA